MFNLLIFSVFCAQIGISTPLVASPVRINELKLPVRMRLAPKSYFDSAHRISHFILL